MGFTASLNAFMAFSSLLIKFSNPFPVSKTVISPGTASTSCILHGLWGMSWSWWFFIHFMALPWWHPKTAVPEGTPSAVCLEEGPTAGRKAGTGNQTWEKTSKQGMNRDEASFGARFKRYCKPAAKHHWERITPVPDQTGKHESGLERIMRYLVLIIFEGSFCLLLPTLWNLMARLGYI